MAKTLEQLKAERKKRQEEGTNLPSSAVRNEDDSDGVYANTRSLYQVKMDRLNSYEGYQDKNGRTDLVKLKKMRKAGHFSDNYDTDSINNWYNAAQTTLKSVADNINKNAYSYAMSENSTNDAKILADLEKESDYINSYLSQNKNSDLSSLYKTYSQSIADYKQKIYDLQGASNRTNSEDDFNTAVNKDSLQKRLEEKYKSSFGKYSLIMNDINNSSSDEEKLSKMAAYASGDNRYSYLMATDTVPSKEQIEQYNKDTESIFEAKMSKYDNSTYGDLVKAYENTNNYKEKQYLRNRALEVASSSDLQGEKDNLIEQIDELAKEIETAKPLEQDKLVKQREKLQQTLYNLEVSSIDTKIENKSSSENLEEQKEWKNKYNDYTFEELLLAQEQSADEKEKQRFKDFAYEVGNSEELSAHRDKLKAEYDKLYSELNSYDNKKYDEALKHMMNIEDELDILDSKIKDKIKEETRTEALDTINNNDEVKSVLDVLYKANNSKYTGSNPDEAVASYEQEYTSIVSDSEKADAQRKYDDLIEKGYDMDTLYQEYERSLNERRSAAQIEQQAEYAKDNPIPATINSVVASAYLSPLDVTKSIGAAMGDGYIDTNTFYSRQAGTMQSAVADKFDNPIAKTLYSSGTSIAENLLLMPVTLSTGGVGKAITFGIYGAQGASGGIADTYDNTGDIGKSLETGIAQGIAEGLFEELSLDQYQGIKQIMESGSATLGDVLKKMGVSALVEGDEELNTSLVNTITDQIINGDKSQLMVSYNDYIAQGMTEQQAGWQAAKDYGMQLVQDFAGGAIAGGFLSSGAAVGSYAAKKASDSLNGADIKEKSKTFSKDNKNINLESDSVNNLISKGKSYSEDTQAYRLAAKLEKQAAKKGDSSKVSNLKLGQLRNAIIEESSKSIQSMRKSVIGKTVEANRDTLTSKEKEIIQKIENDTELTDKDYDVIDNSKVLTNLDKAIFKATSEQRNNLSDAVKATHSPLVDVKGTDLTDYDSSKSDNDMLKQWASDMELNENETENFINDYDPQSMSLKSYAYTYNIYNNYGKFGVMYNEINADNIQTDIDNTVRINAYKSGLNYRKSYYQTQNALTVAQQELRKRNGGYAEGTVDVSAIKNETVTFAQKKEIKYLEALAQVTGLNVKFVASHNNSKGYINSPNGSYNRATNTITIDINSMKKNENASYINGAMLYTASHELTHVAELNTDTYEALHSAVVSAIGNDNWERLIAKHTKDISKSRNTKSMKAFEINELASSEALAEACSQMLQDSNLISQVADENPSLAKKIINILKGFIENLRKRIRAATNLNVEEVELLKKGVDNLEEIKGLWETAVKEGIKNANARAKAKNNTADNSDVKNQLRTIPEENEIINNIKAVANMKPVVTLKGSEFSKSNADLVTQVTEYFDEVGGYVNTDYGKIELTKKGVKSSIGHGIGRNKAIAFKAVPNVLKEGKIIDFQKNWKNRGYDTAVFAAPIKIANKDYFMAAVIVVEAERNSYYLHEVAIQEKEDNTLFKTGTVKNGTSGKVLSSPIFTLLQKLQSVKNELDDNTKYQSRNTDIDDEYLEAVENNDLETAQKLVDEAAKANGYTIKAYHGTARADRVGNVFLPERATSVPMAFFTDSKEIASNYARDKQDTSLAYDEEYDDYYTQFRTVKNGKSISVSELWNTLPYSERQKIKEKAKHITFDDNYENIIYDENAQYGLGDMDTYTINTHKGNVIDALIDSWLESGTLYENEESFLDVLKIVGLDNVEYRNPDARAEKVYSVYLNIQNAFDTSKNYNQDFIDNITNWAKNTDTSKYQRDTAYADMWDKNNQSIEEWIEKAQGDINNGTTYAWTSIPDSVTAYIKSQGYDGMKDTGGKGGGSKHNVYIPFNSEQIKSADPVTYDNSGNAIPLSERFKEDNIDIRYQLRDNDAISNRELLSNALLSVAKTGEEKANLQAYQEGIAKINEDTARLNDINKQIKNISFTKGSDRSQLVKLKNQKEILTKRINRYDKALLKLEGMDTINRILDVEKAKVKKKLGEKYNDKYYEQKARFREQNDEAVKNVSQYYQDRIAEIREWYKEHEKQRHSEDVKHYNERMRDIRRIRDDKIAKLRKDKNDRIAEIRNEYSKKIEQQKWHDRIIAENARDRRDTSTTINKIKKFHKKLVQMSTKPTDNNYIPIEIVDSGVYKAILDLTTSMINDEGTKVAQKLMKINQTLSKLISQYDTNGDYAAEVNNSDMLNQVTALANMLEGKNLRRKTSNNPNGITLGEAEDIYVTVKSIYDGIKSATKQIGRDERISNAESGHRIIEEINRVKKGKSVSSQAQSFMLSAMRTIDMYCGYNQNAELNKHANRLNKGVRTRNYFQMECEKRFNALTDNNRKAYKRSLQEAVVIKYIQNNGEIGSIKISRMQGLQILMSWEREMHNDKLVHMQTGGIKIANLERLIKGKSSIFSEAQEVRVNQSLINAISKTMTDFELQYKHIAEEYFNMYSKDAINEVSRLLKHRDIATEDYYIPFTTDSDFLIKELSDLKYDATIEGMGMLKTLSTKAQQPIQIVGLNNVINRHIADTAKYYGLAIPIRNFKRAMNIIDYTENVAPKNMSKDAKIGKKMMNDSVRHAISSKWGDNAVRLINRMIADLEAPRVNYNNVFDTVDRAYNALQSGFVNATLTSNISVIMKQAASYPTAGAYLSGGSLAKGLKDINKILGKGWRATCDEIDAHTAQHYMRRIGMSQEEIANMLNSKLGNLPTPLNPTKWIQAVDCATTALLWHATKEEINTKYRKAKKDIGTNEYWQEVTSLYDKIIEDTQPMYDSLHRSEAQKQTNAVFKALFMFKTQPMQNTGILIDAVSRCKANPNKDNANILRKAIFSQISSLATFSTMTFIAAALLHKWDKYRDDEDDEVTAQSIITRILWDMLGNTPALIAPIGGSEIYSLISSIIEGDDWYGLEIPVLEEIGDTVTAFQQCRDTIENTIGMLEYCDEADFMPLFENACDFLGQIASMFGVPYDNAKNLLNSGKSYLNDIFSDNSDPFEKSNSEYAESYDKAYLRGDKEKAKKIIDNFYNKKLKKHKAKKEANPKKYENTTPEKKAKAAVRDALKNKYKIEYQKAFLKNDEDKKKEIVSLLRDSGYMTWDNKTLSMVLAEWASNSKEDIKESFAK